MNIIIKGRGQGKTYGLLKMSHSFGYVICVYDEGRAIDLKSAADQMGFDIPDPVPVQELYKLQGSWVPVLIDDIEEVLIKLFPVPVAAFTASKQKSFWTGSVDPPLDSREVIVELEDGSKGVGYYMERPGNWVVNGKFDFDAGKVVRWCDLPE